MYARLLVAVSLVATAGLDAQTGVRRINPPTLAAPTGYTHVTVGPDGRTVHVAGQVALDRTGQVVGAGDFRAQTERVFENLRLAFESVGATFDDVLKTTTFVTDLSELDAFRAVRNRVLRPDQFPPNTLVRVAALARPEYLIEIEAVAMLRAPLGQGRE
jgi:enamine deaminase RidA (YjgF/YER057c/UK114 family)